MVSSRSKGSAAESQSLLSQYEQYSDTDDY